MPSRLIHISEADANAAKYEFSNHPEPIVQKRMLCLRLKYRNYQNQEIADILEVSRNTVGNYLSLYASLGMEGLRTLNYQGPMSKLDKHQPKIEASFRQQAPRSVKEARERIKKLTGVKRSLTNSCSRFYEPYGHEAQGYRSDTRQSRSGAPKTIPGANPSAAVAKSQGRSVSCLVSGQCAFRSGSLCCHRLVF